MIRSIFCQLKRIRSWKILLILIRLTSQQKNGGNVIMVYFYFAMYIYMLLHLHISVHLTVIRFTMGVHSKISACHLNRIRNIAKRWTLTAITMVIFSLKHTRPVFANLEKKLIDRHDFEEAYHFILIYCLYIFLFSKPLVVRCKAFLINQRFQ